MSAGLQVFGMSAAFDALESFADEMTDDTAYVGTTAEYGAAVEFGTSGPFEINAPVKIDGNWRYIGTHPGVPAQPYLRPALREVMAPNVISEVLGGVLEGQIDNKALQIAFEAEKLASENAPVDTGNLQGSIAAGASETEMRAKSEEEQ